jgi:hypothetical protein
LVDGFAGKGIDFWTADFIIGCFAHREGARYPA